jgi:hypothetical protein
MPTQKSPESLLSQGNLEVRRVTWRVFHLLSRENFKEELLTSITRYSNINHKVHGTTSSQETSSGTGWVLCNNDWLL